MTPDEERTKAWLEKRGYKTEYEPDFIPEGQQRPDFWAVAQRGNPRELWVEVKQIDEDDYLKSLNTLAKKKWNSIKGEGVNHFVKMRKTGNYLLQKGYESNLIWEVMNKLKKGEV